MDRQAISWDAVAMKNAARFLLTLALAGVCLGWLPQEKGKRKMRMAVSPYLSWIIPECDDPRTSLVFAGLINAPRGQSD